MPKTKHSNRLIQEKSPYLLQHAHNPVDWFPWGDEAFAEAKRRDVPLLVSIGYSSCHWCHVMERESFEDVDTAAYMNEHFVAIKVDREERPDVDHLYMEACVALTGSGGWPLNCFVDHERRPFYAGTYFPKGNRHGMPGFATVLETVAELWEGNRARIDEAAAAITEHLSGQVQPATRAAEAADAERAFELLEHSFDARFGGFGGAPKFPSAHNLLFLLRYAQATGERRALELVEKTLDGMAAGGIYDHIGGGFCRYSTDSRWLVPHFEKMLYDNAMLMMAYAEGRAALGREDYAGAVRGIVGFLQREMTHPEGGFFTALDADSEGVEGLYYLWSPAEVKRILGDEDGERYCALMDITPQGNFEGKNIPNCIGRELNAEDAAFARGCAGLLLLAREKRVKPFRDDKVATAGNALCIAALAVAGRLLGEPEYTAMAERAAQFLLGNLAQGGRLRSSWREGVAAHPATSDDYAYLVWALLELYQTTLQPEWLALCADWARRMLTLFWDERSSGLFLSGSDVTDLPLRQKNTHDGALPSGISVAAGCLLRLGRLLADEELEAKANAILDTLSGGGYPGGSTMLLSAWLHRQALGAEVVIAAGDGLEAMLGACGGFLPFAVFAVRGTGHEALDALSTRFAAMQPVGGLATAYVCNSGACRAPITDTEELRRLLVVGK